MAFTKKNTRTVSLRSGQTFDYHLKRDWDYKSRRVVVQETDHDGQYLLIDLYHHYFLPSRVMIRHAIRAAFRFGWTPSQKKTPMYLRFDGADFVLTDVATGGCEIIGKSRT